jgi:hypothetical protein
MSRNTLCGTAKPHEYGTFKVVTAKLLEPQVIYGVQPKPGWPTFDIKLGVLELEIESTSPLIMQRFGCGIRRG